MPGPKAWLRRVGLGVGRGLGSSEGVVSRGEEGREDLLPGATARCGAVCCGGDSVSQLLHGPGQMCLQSDLSREGRGLSSPAELPWKVEGKLGQWWGSPSGRHRGCWERVTVRQGLGLRQLQTRAPSVVEPLAHPFFICGFGGQVRGIHRGSQAGTVPAPESSS